MNLGWFLPILVLIPVLFSIISLVVRSAKAVLCFCAVGTFFTAVLSCSVAWKILHTVPVFAVRDWFMMDALSAYHLVVMMMVYSLSAFYGVIYFGREISLGQFSNKLGRRYGSLWFGSLSAMVLVLVSNNLGIMWVGIEATTLLTAFLICIHRSAGALEAMWKYLLMCSVGVAVAFLGILLVAASTAPVSLHGSEALLWTALRDSARQLDPSLLKAGFIFLVIGYGTKAGLAPMHNWLPDAHSQAPSPVSAVFSGILLNVALYCILRCLSLVELLPGNEGWGRGILVAVGLLSIVLAATFIVFQHDIKRLLAYSSVEHIGIITLGIGIGGFGSVAALFHMMNHSLAKIISFACAGELGQRFGTHDMRRLTGIIKQVPVWGTGLIVGLLVLIGVAPFAVFLSEFFILKAILDQHAYWTAGLFLVGVGVVFISVLYRVINMAWTPSVAIVESEKWTWLHGVFVGLPLTVLFLLGVWMPAPLLHVLSMAAGLIGGTP